jgi:hypothetical protein
MGWECSLCDDEHEGTPLLFGADAPWRLFVPEEDFASRVELTEGLCVVDDAQFFLRGHLELPVHDHEAPFVWSVWCSISRASFERMTANWDDPARVHTAPYFGWLVTELPYEPSTRNLKTNLHERAPGIVPYILVEPTDHPLAVAQREGVTLAWVRATAHALATGAPLPDQRP